MVTPSRTATRKPMVSETIGLRYQGSSGSAPPVSPSLASRESNESSLPSNGGSSRTEPIVKNAAEAFDANVVR